MCTLYFLLTPSFHYFPGLPSTIAPVPHPARLSPFGHSTTSHTNICQGPSFCCFSSVNRLWKQERDESISLLEADFHCAGFACSCSSTHINFALIVHVLHQSDVLLWYPLASRTPIQFFTYAFPRSINIKCKSCYMSLYLSCSCRST